MRLKNRSSPFWFQSVDETAHVAALGDLFLDIELKGRECTGDAPVPFHGDIAEVGDFLLTIRQLLPGMNQRAIMKFNDVTVRGRFHDLHLEQFLAQLAWKLSRKLL